MALFIIFKGPSLKQIKLTFLIGLTSTLNLRKRDNDKDFTKNDYFDWTILY